ncbi:MAG: hypothetical protein RL514_1934 [Verrucomicrobiota bacterium]|jgi:hypothetical protein
MSDEATGKSGKMWLYVVGILVSLPLFYGLSTGPMVVLAARKILPEPVLSVYAPLDWFTEMTGSDELIETYVGACLKLTGTSVP